MICCCVPRRFRLLNVNSYHLADIFDGYTGTPRVVPGGLNPNAAYNAVHAISQVSMIMCSAGNWPQVLVPLVHVTRLFLLTWSTTDDVP